MSCDNSNSNNRPVGVSYDSRSRATGLSELSSISVSSVSASDRVYTNTITSLSGGVTVFTGPISATGYLGAGGGSGISAFIELTDVDPATPYIQHRIVTMNATPFLTTSAPSDVMTNAGYINSTQIAATYETIVNTNLISGRVTDLENTRTLEDLSDVVLSPPLTNGQVLTYSSSTNTWINSDPTGGSGTGSGVSTFIALSDTPSTYTGNASRYVKVNSAQTALEFVHDPTYLATSSASSIYATSANLNSHITSAVHWTLATLNTNYINASGDTANANFFFSGLSGTQVSATTLKLPITNSVLYIGSNNTVIGKPYVVGGGWADAIESLLALDSDSNIIAIGSGTFATVSHSHALSSLTDTSIATPSIGQVLVWAGSNWQASSNPAGVTDHGLLTGLSDNDHPQYVLSATNLQLSSNVANHIASAVHWDLATLNTNYINASGDFANGNFYFSALSATTISATNLVIDTITVSATGYIIASAISATTISATNLIVDTISISATSYIIASSVSAVSVSATSIRSPSVSATYLAGMYLNVGSASYGTGDPTGGSDGDLYFKYTPP